jgi:hypothetical protein
MNTKSSNASRRAYNRANISPQSLVYTGPLRLGGIKDQQDTHVVEVTIVTSIVTNGSGVCAAVIANNPSTSSEWTSLSSLYDEYRVLSQEDIYYPIANETYTASFIPAVMVHIVDRDSSGALASLATGLYYASSKISNSNRQHTTSVRMTGSEDAGFTTTSIPSSTWWHKMFFSGATSSVTYGTCVTKLLVQFRGRL